MTCFVDGNRRMCCYMHRFTVNVILVWLTKICNAADYTSVRALSSNRGPRPLENIPDAI
jgi:hypothetical protein